MAYPLLKEDCWDIRKEHTLNHLEPAPKTKGSPLSPTQPSLENGARDRQGIRETSAHDESETPPLANPEAAGEPNKPADSVVPGPWWDVEDERWVDDDGHPISQLEPESQPDSHPIASSWVEINQHGNHGTKGDVLDKPVPRFQFTPSEGYNGEPVTTQAYASEGAACKSAVIDCTNSTTKNTARLQQHSGTTAAPPTPGVEEQVTTDARWGSPGNLKRQREEFDSYNASDTGHGDLGPESGSPPLDTSKKLKSHRAEMTNRKRWMTISIQDVKHAIKHVESAVEQIGKLDSLFKRLGSDSLPMEEKKIIDASLEANDSLWDAIQILENHRVSMQNEGGEDSEDDEF